MEILTEKNEIIEKQNTQIENMVQALLHVRKKLFGSSTEASTQIEGQLFFFQEAQKLAEELGVEQKFPESGSPNTAITAFPVYAFHATASLCLLKSIPSIANIALME